MPGEGQTTRLPAGSEYRSIYGDEAARRFFESRSVEYQAWLLSDDGCMPADPVAVATEHHIRMNFSPESADLILKDPVSMDAFYSNVARQMRRAERSAGGPVATALPRKTAPRVPPYRKAVISPELRWEVFERDGFTCRHCGSRRVLQADHVVAESKGGPTTLDNLQTLCKSCNVKKGTR